MQIFLLVLSIIGIIIASIVVIAVLLSVIRWKLNIGYLGKNKLYFALYFHKLKLFSFQKRINRDKKTDTEINYESTMNKIKQYNSKFRENKDLINDILRLVNKNIEVQSYSVFLDIGVGNAALTGIVCGAAYALLGIISGFISNIIRVKEKCEMLVTPQHNKFIFDISGNVVIDFRIVNVIKLYLGLCKLGILS